MRARGVTGRASAVFVERDVGVLVPHQAQDFGLCARAVAARGGPTNAFARVSAGATADDDWRAGRCEHNKCKRQSSAHHTED